jgi:ATP-binding cassette subfamily B protein
MRRINDCDVQERGIRIVRILRYLKGSGVVVFIVFVALIVQALCELSLPSYTSDIVDIGIQQKGISNAVPLWISPDTLSRLQLLMTDDEISLVNSAYALNEDGIYELTAFGKDRIEVLSDVFSIPMAALSHLQNTPAADLQGLQQALIAGALTKEQLLLIRERVLESLDGFADSIILQRAVLFLQEEYAALGIDVGRLQINYLIGTGAKMLAVTAMMAIAAILVNLLGSRLSAKIGRDLRERVFERVVSFSAAELDRFSTASLITRSTNDIQQVQMVVVMMLRVALYSPILGIGGIIKVSRTNTGMGWIIVVAVCAVMLLVTSLIAVTMPKFKKMQTRIDRVNQVGREMLTGISVIRAFNREKHEEQRFDIANRDLMGTQLFVNRAMSFMMPAMMLLMNLITVLIVWIGAKRIDLGHLQVGEMMAFISYTMQIVMSFTMLTMMSISLPRASVAAGRIEEVLQTQPSIANPPKEREVTREHWDGVVEFHDVCFRFEGADRDVLEHISFTAKPGQTTAIIGSTGSGKSTLIHLIPRFYDVTGGKITIDGVDIRDISLRELRSLLGFVPQKSILFSGDIRSNLKFGGSDIDDQAMIEAAEIAQAAEFIEEKPGKYDSPIAQGGSNVSGGQRQRLSIARAIAKKPKILLLDDSFSAVDYKTEVAMRRGLSEKAKDMTVIVVAQRISTIMHADQIVVLDQGRVAGIGTHETLMRTCRTYREIARSQLSESELAI